MAAVAAVLLFLFCPVAGADPGDAASGRQRSKAELCQECHGEDGNSLSASTPKLAGQSPSYIAKQLADFQSGARKHVVMSVMAAPLSEQDRLDIAAYFSSNQRVPEAERLKNAQGQELFLNGDVDRGIPACAGCHGDHGQGFSLPDVTYPSLAAQHYTYLRIQLTGWRIGERSNSKGDVMSRVAKTLSDEDINALAEYLSGL